MTTIRKTRKSEFDTRLDAIRAEVGALSNVIHIEPHDAEMIRAANQVKTHLELAYRQQAALVQALVENLGTLYELPEGLETVVSLSPDGKGHSVIICVAPPEAPPEAPPTPLPPEVPAQLTAEA